LPKEIAWHHQAHIVSLLKAALAEAFPDRYNSKNESAKVPIVSTVAYTIGPRMGRPLQSCAVTIRMLSLFWNCPLVAANHCVGHIEIILSSYMCLVCEISVIALKSLLTYSWQQFTEQLYNFLIVLIFLRLKLQYIIWKES